MNDCYLGSADELLRRLQVERRVGLSLQSVKKRRAKQGWNVIPRASRRPLFFKYFDRFKDVLVLVLLLGAVASLVFGRYGDALIIGVAILLDATLSFAQVLRTERTLEKLQEQLQPTATVIRDESEVKIPARELVIGDLIEVRAGERVPADARLIETRSLRVQEASLTGESDDSVKEVISLKKRTAVSNRKNMIFMGTLVTKGSGIAVVTAIGSTTEIGKIAQMLKVSKSPTSPLNKQLQRTGLRIGTALLLAVLALAVVGIYAGNNLIDTTVTAITLIVSAVPEDLTMILTIALTIGVARILRQKGVVRELGSGETLGSATVICTDKTGTLTYGKMKGERLDLMNGSEVNAGEKVSDSVNKLGIIGMALANDAHRALTADKEVYYLGSSTEKAALEFAESCGVVQQDLRREWKQRDAISFNRRWKYRATLNDHPNQSVRYLFVTGAPEVLLQKSSASINELGEVSKIDPEGRYMLEQRVLELAGTGSRLMGVAMRRNVTDKEIDHSDIVELVFVGVFMIRDVVRPDVKGVIKQTKRAGIDIKIVTGDHLETAKSIARQVGIMSSQDRVMTTEDLQRINDIELAEEVENITIFARVTPLDKQRIIKALQNKGHIVAMTGDGVNDAVALKSADIGVAMGSGKDIAKEAADLVLLDDHFATITHAVREGRVLRDNIKKVLAFLLATNAAEVAIFFVSLMFGLPLPLLPAQILWVNLVTDGTSDIALSLEPRERNVMKRPPRDPQAPLLGWGLFYHICFTGAVITAFTMLLYGYLSWSGIENLKYGRTMAFTFVSIVSLLSVWSFRSLDESILRRGFWGNRWVPVSLGVSAGLHMMAIYVPQLQKFFDTVPLSIKDWALIVILSLIAILVIDSRKLVRKLLIRWWPRDDRDYQRNSHDHREWSRAAATK